MKIDWKRLLLYCGIFFAATLAVRLLHLRQIAAAGDSLTKDHPYVRGICILVPEVLSIGLYTIARKGFFELLIASLLTGGQWGVSGCLASFCVTIPLIWIIDQLRMVYELHFKRTNSG